MNVNFTFIYIYIFTITAVNCSSCNASYRGMILNWTKRNEARYDFRNMKPSQIYVKLSCNAERSTHNWKLYEKNWKTCCTTSWANVFCKLSDKAKIVFIRDRKFFIKKAGFALQNQNLIIVLLLFCFVIWGILSIKDYWYH